MLPGAAHLNKVSPQPRQGLVPASVSKLRILCAAQVMRMHIIDNVRQRIEAGLRDFVSEIRVCTVVFLGFPSLSVSDVAAYLCTLTHLRNIT